MVSLTWLAHMSKLAERTKVAKGVRKNFSRGVQRRHFASFSGCWRCNANGHSQNALLFLHHEVNAPMIARAPFASILKNFSSGALLYEFATKVHVLLSVTNFAELAHTYKSWVWNGPELLINTFAVLSLVCAGWTELTSEIFCPTCFLHFAYTKCFFQS